MQPDQDFQQFLDAISDCFMARDFAPWKDRIVLPFTLITREGPVLLETVEALRQNFDQYLRASDIMKLDLVVRRPISLEACPDGTWLGTYETRLLRQGQDATDPYISTALLEQGPDGYKMRSILNARGHHEWTGEQPQVLRPIT